jgi:GT2 family glycosyltransferase
MTTLAVVVPTYGRPHHVGPMLEELARQTRPPDEVVYVVRPTDVATNAALDAARTPLHLTRAFVEVPGHVPPIREGTRRTHSEVIAIIDDDARPDPSWCARILDHFGTAPRLGILAGRVREEGRNVPPSSVVRRGKVGQVLWPGRLPHEFLSWESSTPLDVMAAGGGNMAYRREVLSDLEFDFRLNIGSSRFYENDLCWQAKNAGWQVRDTPDVLVDHFSDAAARVGNRPGHVPHAFTVGHNWALVVLKNADTPTRIAFLPYWFLWGGSTAPGPLRWLAAQALGRRRPLREVVDGTRGKVAALREMIHSR